MIVLITNDLHPAVRGRMKLWFVEIKPGVFVIGESGYLSKKITHFLLKQKLGAGSLLIESSTSSPGYKIHTFGQSDKQLIRVTNLQLIVANNKILKLDL